MNHPKNPAPTSPTLRCAIYTRKSTEEGLDQDFNSLDAQRESGEAYVKSLHNEGWACLPERYDDGGFTGGNMDRPALARLLADVEAGRVDCVVVYKVDRLSRSLLDFARIMSVFDERGVSFVSVTQQFNTSSSMGRLTLNVLLSFAQFEREIISERTRDKIAAARRKGKWSGGMPVLGYDVDPRGSRLIVNPIEAERVRTLYAWYLEHESLIATAREAESRGWRNKEWTTRAGKTRGGKPFTKTSLHKLLTNVAYLGKVRYKDEVHEGEHEAIVDAELWRGVQARLAHNGRSGGARNQHGALLKGLLRCGPCGCAMSPTHSTKKNGKRYRYYVCTAAQKRGWDACPSKSVPAGPIERLVVAQVRRVAAARELTARTWAELGRQKQAESDLLDQEQRALRRDLTRWSNEARGLLPRLSPGDPDSAAAARLAELQERLRHAEALAAEKAERLAQLRRRAADQEGVQKALEEFESVWGSLALREQSRVIGLLVESVAYDGGTGQVGVTLNAAAGRLLDQAAADYGESAA